MLSSELITIEGSVTATGASGGGGRGESGAGGGGRIKVFHGTLDDATGTILAGTVYFEATE